MVTVPVSATTADVRLRFNSNTGAPSGQVAEFEVCGTPAPNPDLTVSNVTWSPASPIETNTITLSATVNNIGDSASARDRGRSSTSTARSRAPATSVASPPARRAR